MGLGTFKTHHPPIHQRHQNPSGAVDARAAFDRLGGEFGVPFVIAGFEVDKGNEGFLVRAFIADAEEAGFADDKSEPTVKAPTSLS